jgi:transposase-like protein
LTHGLTAQKFLPEVLGRERLVRYREQLQAEWQPGTPTEEHLVEEMARHAAGMDRASQIEIAVLRYSAKRRCDPLYADGADPESDTEARLTGAVTGDAIDRVSRYRITHERGYYRALRLLVQVKQREADRHQRRCAVGKARFATEAECEAYLLARWEQGAIGCPQCGLARGSWLARRKRWQCGGCRGQFGLRAGTVMARSPLPLRAWFAAIGQLLIKPSSSTSELAEATGVRRPATLRRMAQRIRGAIDSPEASRLLAGLEESFKGPADRGVPAGTPFFETNS